MGRPQTASKPVTSETVAEELIKNHVIDETDVEAVAAEIMDNIENGVPLSEKTESILQTVSTETDD
jgi:hypothetical protein